MGYMYARKNADDEEEYGNENRGRRDRAGDVKKLTEHSMTTRNRTKVMMKTQE